MTLLRGPAGAVSGGGEGHTAVFEAVLIGDMGQQRWVNMGQYGSTAVFESGPLASYL